MTIFVVCDLCKKKLYEVLFKPGDAQTFHSAKCYCEECSKKINTTESSSEEVHLLEKI